MTHARRSPLLGTILAVMCLAALFSDRTSGALDRPIVDTRRGECQVNLNQEIVQQLPLAGRTPGSLAGVMPERATMQFQQNATGNVTGALVIVDGQTLYDFDRVKDRKSACIISGEIPRIQLGTSGYAGRLEFNWSGRPSERITFKASKLTFNGGPFRGEGKFFYLPAAGQTADQPPPENVPVVPGPPLPPTEPLGYLGPGDIRVPDGTTFDVAMNVRNHTNHQGHLVNVGTFEDYLCRKAEGYSQISVYNATRDSFNFKRTLQPRPNLIWQDGRCTANADRSVNCNVEGTFHNIPVRSSWTARAVQGSTNIEGEGSLEIRGDTLRYDLSGRWGPRF